MINFSDQIEDIRTTTICNLQDSVGLDVEGAELHNELFNTDYFLIGTERAKKWLGDETLPVRNRQFWRGEYRLK